MISRRRPGSPNRKTNSISFHFKLTKPGKSVKSLFAAPREIGGASPSPAPVSFSAVPPLPEPTSTKRKASTSAPSSPTTIRPPRKRPALIQRVLHFDTTKRLTLRPLKALGSPTAGFRSFLTTNEGSDIDLGSGSDRGISVSSQSTSSLASGRGNTRAPGGRERDARDARRVLRTIVEVKEGKYKVKKGGPRGKDLIHRTLRYHGYQLLWKELQKSENKEILDYVNGRKFHFDYTRRPFKGDKQFVIHMPSSFHEGMAGQFNDRIVKWLGNIENGTLCTTAGSRKGETMKIASHISSTLAKRVKYTEPRNDQLEPDLSFKHRFAPVAGLLVEVAWSQSNLQLPDRARRYIEGKKGLIRTVVGLNMNNIYRGGCRATFSVWEAEQIGNKWKLATSEANKEFINEKGEPVSGCELHLTLRDFICEKQVAKFGEIENVPLKIPSAQLYDFYKSAFEDHMMDKAMEEIEGVKGVVNEALKTFLDIEKVIQEQSTEDTDGRTVMGKTELVNVKTMLEEVEKKISDMKKALKSVEEKLTDTMEMVKDEKIEVENEVTELEKKLAEVRATAERIVEPAPKPKRSRIPSAFKRASKK